MSDPTAMQYHLSKATDAWRNEQRRLCGAARHYLGDRAMQPARQAIAAMGRDGSADQHDAAFGWLAVHFLGGKGPLGCLSAEQASGAVA